MRAGGGPRPGPHLPPAVRVSAGPPSPCRPGPTAPHTQHRPTGDRYISASLCPRYVSFRRSRGYFTRLKFRLFAIREREAEALVPGGNPRRDPGPRIGAAQGKNMRDPFNAPVDFTNEDHHAGNELNRTNVMLSVRDYGSQNGDAKPFAVNTDTLVRHQLQGASLHNDLTAEDSITRLMDPETKELYFRSRSQEEEILLLHKQIADASLKELQLLSEKHILERKLSDLRMAVDEKQEDAISGALKQLSQKKSHLEENMRLANDLKGEEEELYFFTSSLLSMLAEYNVRPPQINASTITTGTKLGKGINPALAAYPTTMIYAVEGPQPLTPLRSKLCMSQQFVFANKRYNL
ncbi:hypothetical protein GUJ93_ZPchr0003g17720 [Zizania palustris]|uniref:Uncharacterized protein n=1 Tax=Zizania palustris TaxID=103762 RepID=A0A8J5VJL2_ZIZPA|nr:hypothetical protein GUJ93_ZPchr0003g17720 [Zizania palustris]